MTRAGVNRSSIVRSTDKRVTIVRAALCLSANRWCASPKGCVIHPGEVDTGMTKHTAPGAPPAKHATRPSVVGKEDISGPRGRYRTFVSTLTTAARTRKLWPFLRVPSAVPPAALTRCCRPYTCVRCPSCWIQPDAANRRVIKYLCKHQHQSHPGQSGPKPTPKSGQQAQGEALLCVSFHKFNQN